MTFLTSPIGLVVVGITALIAIIVLLIANWDTVSAKLQQGFHFIQSVLQGFDNFLQGVFATDFTEQFGVFGNVLNAPKIVHLIKMKIICFLKRCLQAGFQKADSNEGQGLSVKKPGSGRRSCG